MIIVTGSNGFIGSNLIKGLNEIGHKDIIAVDDQDDPELKENIAHCDIQDFLNIDEFINLIRNNEIDGTKIRAIFHQGACSNTCLLYTSPSPRDYAASRMPSSA